MRIPLSWLREFVPVEDDPEMLAERLPMLGLGVDGIDVVGGDPVLDVAVAANRPDLLSVLGVAREIAAAWGLEVTLPPGAPADAPEAPASMTGVTSASVTDVIIEDPQWCPRYTAHVVTGVRVGPSPAWMTHRLEAAGIRGINNVVDVTNYVMLEQGQPLHPFDLDRLAEHRIVVRRARPGERLLTLDGIERVLGEEMVAIADAERVVALAGVIGGGETEIGEGTRRVLLEAAAFWGPAVRRTSRRLGVRTESSARFERGLDPRLVLPAAQRAARLIAEVAGGQVLAGALDVYPRPSQAAQIGLRHARITRVLGVTVAPPQVEAILRRLGCEVGADGDGRVVVTPPAGRVDLAREEDLIEEVARHHGYDRIPEALPVEAAQPGSRPPDVEAERAVRDVLIRAGLTEAVTVSLIHPSVLDRMSLADGDPGRAAVALANPLIADHTHLRTMVLPGLLEAVRVNLRRGTDAVHFFEVGRTFRPAAAVETAGKGVVERRGLALAMRGPLLLPGWEGEDGDAEATFFHLKGILETLFHELGLSLHVVEAARPWLHPGRSAALLVSDDGAAVQEIGAFGELHPLTARAFDLTGRVCVAEADLEGVLPRVARVAQFAALPRHPAVERDLALVLAEQVPHAMVARLIRDGAGAWLESADLFDVYVGPPVPAGKRSLAYRLRFRARDRTLTAQEVEEALDRIKHLLRNELAAEMRE